MPDGMRVHRASSSEAAPSGAPTAGPARPSAASASVPRTATTGDRRRTAARSTARRGPDDRIDQLRGRSRAQAATTGVRLGVDFDGRRPSNGTSAWERSGAADLGSPPADGARGASTSPPSAAAAGAFERGSNAVHRRERAGLGRRSRASPPSQRWLSRGGAGFRWDRRPVQRIGGDARDSRAGSPVRPGRRGMIWRYEVVVSVFFVPGSDGSGTTGRRESDLGGRAAMGQTSARAEHREGRCAETLRRGGGLRLRTRCALEAGARDHFFVVERCSTTARIASRHRFCAARIALVPRVEHSGVRLRHAVEASAVVGAEDFTCRYGRRALLRGTDRSGRPRSTSVFARHARR